MPNDPNHEPAATPGLKARPRGQAPTQGPRLEPDTAALSGAEALDRAWQETPEVRPERVAQAKALLKDVSYLPAEVVAKIASLMAERLSQF